MKKSAQFLDELNLIGKSIYENTLALLKEKKVESINITPYIVENYISTYYFYDCNKDGYGEALEVSSLNLKDDKIILSMDTNFGNYFGEYSSRDFSVNEQLYLLEMLENLFEAIKEYDLPLLKEDEYDLY